MDSNAELEQINQSLRTVSNRQVEFLDRLRHVEERLDGYIERIRKQEERLAAIEKKLERVR